MKKSMYIIPETETTPLYLSACIMSGVEEGDDPVHTDINTGNGGFGAPRKVF